MNFSEKDFEIFAEAEGDSCKACMTGFNEGKRVTQNEYQAYYDKFLQYLEPKFTSLWDFINPVLSYFKINLK